MKLQITVNGTEITDEELEAAHDKAHDDHPEHDGNDYGAFNKFIHHMQQQMADIGIPPDYTEYALSHTLEVLGELGAEVVIVDKEQALTKVDDKGGI